MKESPDPSSPPSRLANITTMWTMLRDAHDLQGDEARQAQEQILSRYGTAVYRYLLAAVRDPNLADDLCQEFALRLIKGGFRHADPSRGRFRDYLKTSLFHLVSEFRRGKGPRVVSGDFDADELAIDSSPDELERAFVDGWRDELLAKSWEALSARNAQLFRVLKLKSDNPSASSQALASMASQQSGVSLTAAAFRQQLKRARDQFSATLIEEIGFSLEHPTEENVQAELQDLDLWRFVNRGRD